MSLWLCKVWEVWFGREAVFSTLNAVTAKLPAIAAAVRRKARSHGAATVPGAYTRIRGLPGARP